MQHLPLRRMSESIISFLIVSVTDVSFHPLCPRVGIYLRRHDIISIARRVATVASRLHFDMAFDRYFTLFLQFAGISGINKDIALIINDIGLIADSHKA